MNKKAKIGIVLAILVVIAGLWAIKNIDFNKEEPVATVPVLPTDEPSTEEVVTEETSSQEDLAMEWTSMDFDELLSHNKPMVLYFGAEDCPPCQEMKDDFVAFHDEHKEEASIRFYDVWKKPELVGNYPIMIIPTMVFFLPDGTPYDPGERFVEEGLLFSKYLDKDTEEHALTTHTGILTKDQLDRILADLESTTP